MSPANSYCTRLLSSVAPSAPVRSEAPTTATDFGLSSRSICWLVKRRSLMSRLPLRRPLARAPWFVIPAQAGMTAVTSAWLGLAALDLALVERAEAGLVGLLVEELLGRFLACGDAAELVERLLRADQVFLGVVVRHLAHAADGPFGGAQRVAVLLLEHVGDLLDAVAQLVGGERFVDHALLGRLLAGQVLAHHRVVHRVAEAHQLGRDLGGAAAGEDRPVDLAEAELRVVRAEREVAGEQRAVGAAEAPAVDHRHGRLLVPAQAFPPRVGLALRLAGGADAVGFGHAEVLEQVHPGRPGGAFAGEDEDLDVVAELELVQHLEHA